MNYTNILIGGIIALTTTYSTLAQSLPNLDHYTSLEVGTETTSHNTVTSTTYSIGDKNFAYSGGDGGIIDAFEINPKGALSKIESYRLNNETGPSRGLIADRIEGNDFLFVGNKGDNSVEVFKIATTGKLDRVFILKDTPETYLGTVITLEVIHMQEASYLFVGGLESTPGLSSFKISKDGSLSHVTSLQDDDTIHTDGIIGMYTHLINGKTFLFTGGFHDNGISSFRVYEDGTFKNVSNISDNTTDRYLTGTYPVNGVTLNGNHYVIVGHRHHKYYKRIEFIKKKDFVYHGDGVSVFKISKKGEIQPHFVYVNNEKTLLAGQTKIDLLKIDDQKAYVAVATKDDHSIQILELNASGILEPLTTLPVKYPIYYGMSSIKIKNNYFFLAGSVDQSLKQFFSYQVLKNSETKTKASNVLRHLVCLTYKDEASKEEVEDAVNNFVELKNKIAVIEDFEWGTNTSKEGHDKGFTHCFTLTFKTQEDLETYLHHKAHLELLKNVKPLIKDAFVFDYWN